MVAGKYALLSCNGCCDGQAAPGIGSGMYHPVDSPNGRNETRLERCDRNLTELLQEVRVVQTGVQVLFAFLLTAPLTSRFARLDTSQRIEYYVTLAFAGAATVLLIAPTAYHRVLFRLGDKEHLVTVANALTIAGLTAVGVSMAGAMVFVTHVIFGSWAGLAAGVVAVTGCGLLWAAMPLARRRSLAAARPSAVSVSPIERSGSLGTHGSEVVADFTRATAPPASST